MNKTFGERFAELRKARHYTQEETAEKLNVTPQAVSKWENDLCMPDVGLFPEIADLFGVSIDELFGREQPHKAEILPKEERAGLESLIMRIVVDDGEGDHVRVNLPCAMLKVFLDTGASVPQFNGSDALKNIDFSQILSLVEQGMIGEFVSVESADGTHVRITVEKIGKN